MFNISKILQLVEKTKSEHRIRLFFSPKQDLPARTGLRKVGERKFTIEYNPELCQTDDIVYEVFRSIQLCNKDWVKLTPKPFNHINKYDSLVAERLSTLLFDQGVKIKMNKEGYQYGGYVKDYFQEVLKNLKDGEQPYDISEEKCSNYVLSTLDYTFYLLNHLIFSEKFIHEFEKLFKVLYTKAVEKADLVKKIVSGSKSWEYGEVIKTLKEIVEVLSLNKIVVFDFSDSER
jgi:hypothetical protein